MCVACAGRRPTWYPAGRYLLQHGDVAQARGDTAGAAQVTLGPLGTAVLLVFTAHGLWSGQTAVNVPNNNT